MKKKKKVLKKYRLEMFKNKNKPKLNKSTNKTKKILQPENLMPNHGTNNNNKKLYKLNFFFRLSKQKNSQLVLSKVGILILIFAFVFYVPSSLTNYCVSCKTNCSYLFFFIDDWDDIDKPTSIFQIIKKQ